MLRTTILSAALSALAAPMVDAKAVYAHFMVADSLGYSADDWRSDMEQALQAGIDGFVFNRNPPYCDKAESLSDREGYASYIDENVETAFGVAEELGNFKIMHSFDFNWNKCNNDNFWNVDKMQTVVGRHADSSAMAKWDGKILVSTFGPGPDSTVSAYDNIDTMFYNFKNSMESSGSSVSIAPSLLQFSYDAQNQDSVDFSDYPNIDGFMNWQAWPNNVKENATAKPDQVLKSALGSKSGPYIMGVSPWQFKALNSGGYSWVQYSDTLFHDRYQLVTAEAEFSPDILEIITWNDYPESHYIADLKDSNNNMASYVDGHNHAPWRIIAKYYNSWFKNGSPPAITMDQVIYWYRTHPANADCASNIENHEYPEDAVFAWALVSEESEITVTVGDNSRTFNADGSGPVQVSVPWPAPFFDQMTPRVTISRGGNVIEEHEGTLPINPGCESPNFNPIVNLCGDGLNSGLPLPNYGSS